MSHQKFRFTKPMAIALASSVVLSGGVPIVAAESDTFSASAGVFDSVSESTAVEVSLKTDDGHDFLKYPHEKVGHGTSVDNTEFVNMFAGKNATFTLDLTIPDEAEIGQTFGVTLPGNLMEGSLGGGDIPLTIDGETVAAVRGWDQGSDSRVVVEIGPGFEKYIGRKIHTEARITFKESYKDPHFTGYLRGTSDPDLNGKPYFTDPYEIEYPFITDFSEKVVTNSYRDQYTYEYRGGQFRRYLGSLKGGMINPSVYEGYGKSYFENMAAYPVIAIVDDKGTKDMADDIAGPHRRVPKTRTVTVDFETYDTDAVPFFPKGGVIKAGTEEAFGFIKLSRTEDHKVFLDEDGAFSSNVYTDNALDHDVTVSFQEIPTPGMKKIRMTIEGVQPEDQIAMFQGEYAGVDVGFKHPYQVGKEVRVRAITDNGLKNITIDGDSNIPGYDDNDHIWEDSYVMQSMNGWADGYIPEPDIKFTADVNDNPADTKATAEKLGEKTALFALRFKNGGEIGETELRIVYPEGATDEEGHTEKTVKPLLFGPGDHHTEYVKLNVPEGFSQNEFKVYPTDQMRLGLKNPLRNSAWTNVSLVQEVTPKYTPITVAQNTTGTVKVPGGHVPGMTYAPGDNVPSWATVNKDGTITVKPGFNVSAKDYSFNVKPTYPKGYEGPETVTAKVTVTTGDRYIDKVTKNGDGKYTLTRNDGEKFTINFADLYDRLGEFEKIERPTREEFNKFITNDFKTVKNIINQFPDDATDIMLTLDEELQKYTERVGKAKGRLTAVENAVIVKVEHDGKGVYRLIRADGDPVEGTIDTSGGITDIIDDGKGNIVIHKADGTNTKIPLSQLTVKETGKGTPQHTVTLTTPQGETVTLHNTHVTEVKKNAKGDYEIYRSDFGNGKKVWKTIKLGELTRKVEKLEKKESPTKAEFDDVRRDIKLTGLLIKQNLTNIKQNSSEYLTLVDEFNAVKVRVDEAEPRMDKIEDNGIASIKHDGKGVYTLVRNNGKDVRGAIVNSKVVKDVTDNGNGTLRIHKVDGTHVDVDIADVTITEKDAGTPKHTVTITSPNGDTVTFGKFDKYVFDVVRNDDGDYEFYRSDIGGGKKLWKKVVLKDLRTRVKALEDAGSPNRQEFNKLIRDIAKTKSDFNKEAARVEGDVAEFTKDVRALEKRMDAIATRVEGLEDADRAWAKCYSGAGLAAIPAALALPLGLLSRVQLPGVAEFNTQIQKNLGAYNPELAKLWGNSGGVLGAIAGASLLAGVIGAIAYTADQCGDYRASDAAKNTPAARLSSGKAPRATAPDDKEVSTPAGRDNTTS